MVDTIIDMDIPGWISEPEIISICEFIDRSGLDDILEIGPFAGRLTYSICKTFPDKSITVIDTFPQHDINFAGMANSSFMTTGKQYLTETFSEDFFRRLHPYQNLTIVKHDMEEYNRKHDLVVLSVSDDKEKCVWHTAIACAKQISNYHTISPGSTYYAGRHVMFDLYETVTYELPNGRPAMYEIKGRK